MEIEEIQSDRIFCNKDLLFEILRHFIRGKYSRRNLRMLRLVNQLFNSIVLRICELEKIKIKKQEVITMISELQIVFANFDEISTELLKTESGKIIWSASRDPRIINDISTNVMVKNFKYKNISQGDSELKNNECTCLGYGITNPDEYNFIYFYIARVNDEWILFNWFPDYGRYHHSGPDLKELFDILIGNVK